MTTKRTKQQVTAVDLFCGGGGLTVGLKKAGFNVVAAVEINQHAASTFKANNPKTKIFVKDIRNVSGREILEISPTGKIDILSGCPPCQGFSSLTTKYRRNDPRNQLIYEMLRLVEEISPKIIMMENVAGLAKRGKKLLDQTLHQLNKWGYITEVGVLQVADYGVPQFRRRLVLLAGRGFHISFPIPSHSKNGIDKPQWCTVYDAIGHFPKPLTMTQVKDNPIKYNWHVVRDLSSVNQLRLSYIKPGQNWKCIPEKIRPKCHQGDYCGFPNVYGRMSWDDVSPTITGGCTTLSKGRFGHPTENRTISVREAACLQTFPDDYIFDTHFMAHVCDIIGNALPCDFAFSLAKQCYEAIIKQK
jgi:DNA (cytosine-5)-methyltransferase 1